MTRAARDKKQTGQAPADDANTALVPITDETVAPALQAVYRGLPGDVVMNVESERIAIGRDILDHLRAIRDTLAPYGRFKEWCEAVGLRYGTVTQRLSRADNKYKQPVLQGITESSVPAPLVAWDIFDCSESETVFHWLSVRMEWNVENTAHPLHHRTSPPRGRIPVVLATDPTLDAAIRHWHGLPGSHQHAPSTDDAETRQQEASTRLDGVVAQYRERFADVVLPEQNAADEDWFPNDLLKGFVGAHAYDILRDGAYLHALRRDCAARKIDFRHMLCMTHLGANSDMACLADVAKALEYDEWCMRVAERAGLAGLATMDTTEATYQTAINSVLTYDLALSVWTEERPDDVAQHEGA